MARWNCGRCRPVTKACRIKFSARGTLLTLVFKECRVIPTELATRTCEQAKWRNWIMRKEARKNSFQFLNLRKSDWVKSLPYTNDRYYRLTHTTGFRNGEHADRENVKRMMRMCRSSGRSSGSARSGCGASSAAIADSIPPPEMSTPRWPYTGKWAMPNGKSSPLHLQKMAPIHRKLRPQCYEPKTAAG